MSKKKDAVELFVYAWTELGFTIGDMEREYRFDRTRMWRFDIAFPSKHLAVEIDGIGYGHNSIKGQKSDCEKQNAAVLAGWRVFRFSTAMLNTEEKLRESVTMVWQFLVAEANPEWEASFTERTE